MIKNRYLRICLFILGALMISATGYAAWKINKEIKEIHLQFDQLPRETSQSQNNESGLIESKLDVSSWKTYRNEEFRFEVKYPKEWQVFQMPVFEGNALTIIGFGVEKITKNQPLLRLPKILISINPDNQDFINDKIANPDYIDITVREISIRNLKAVQLEYFIRANPIPKNRQTEIVISYKGQTYSISGYKDDEVILERVVSTFDFKD